MTLYRKDCPPSLTLAQYQMSMLDTGEQTEAVEQHLQTCPHCRADLKHWQNFIEEEDDLHDQTERDSDNVIRMPASDSSRVVLFPTIAAEPLSAVRGNSSIRRIIATADSTTIRLAFEPLYDDRVKMTVQLASEDVDWSDGMVTIRRDGRTIALCQINSYQIGSCELPDGESFSLSMVAADETLIEFSSIAPQI